MAVLDWTPLRPFALVMAMDLLSLKEQLEGDTIAQAPFLLDVEEIVEVFHCSVVVLLTCQSRGSWSRMWRCCRTLMLKPIGASG